MKNNSTAEYLRSLKPENMPDGLEVLKEGISIGNGIKAGRSRFVRENGYSTYWDYRKECMEKGKINWRIILGLATVEEQVSGIKQIYEFSQRTGLEAHTIQLIPSMLTALPKEYREAAPETTSYTPTSFEDYIAIAEAASMECLCEDQTLSCPNALETTINSVKAGSSVCGLISQFIWRLPGYNDDRQHMIDFVKAIGIIASKKDEYFNIDTYLEDGFPGYFMDCASFIGYALLEHYIVSTLCGARYSVAWGGLLSEIKPRVAIGMAIHKLLSTEDQPVIGYINASTNTQWDHDIHSNYGPSMQEALLHILVEKKYKMAMSIYPVAITEKITVPTVESLMNDEEGAKFIGVSVHNGQSLDYAKQLTHLVKERNKEYFIFMGGKLNAILPGNSVTSDVTDLINELGVLATNDLSETISSIRDFN